MLLIGFIISIIINIWFLSKFMKLKRILGEMSSNSKKFKDELDEITEAWDIIDKAEVAKVYLKNVIKEA